VTDRRCPDCGVRLEPVEFGMSDAYNPHVRTGERREGLLGKLGVDERRSVSALLCPECDRLLWYADGE
jgi:uncharacterized protein with PIN domain